MSAAVLFQTMPPLSEDEYSNLAQSIRDHGIQVPIIVDEQGVVIDGHHRQKIAEDLGVTCPVEIKFGLSDVEKRSLSVSLNIDRRQLSREQRRAIIAESIKADPELSDRDHARRIGVSPTTVGSVRSDLEESGDVSKLDTRTDSLGRSQPATKPSAYIDTETGEIIDGPVTVETTETFKTKTTTGDVPEPKRREPKPVPTGAEAERLNDEQLCQMFGRALLNIEGLTYPQHREWLIEAWPTAHEAATPLAQELGNPKSFRVLAGALNLLADEWERAIG